MTASGKQLNDLTTAIADHFNKNDLARAVRAVLEKDLEDISLHNNKIDIIFALLDWANRRDRLLELLDGLKQRNPSQPFAIRVDEVLVAIAASLQGGGVAANPLKDCLIDGQVFIARDSLCSSVERIIRPGHFPKRISTITGPDAVGKSYSWLLIRHAARNSAGATPVKVDLTDRDMVEEWTPEEVTRSLARQLGLDESSISGLTESENGDAGQSAATSASRRALYAVEWLIGKLSGNQKTWWIVVDGLEAAGLPIATVELMELIANAIADKRINHVYLFLLGFARPLKNVSRTYNVSVPYRALCEDDVRSHAANLVNQYCQGNASERENKAARVADEALQGLNGLVDRESLELMTNQFQEAAERLLME